MHPATQESTPLIALLSSAANTEFALSLHALCCAAL
jgi:hypothetical protein